MPRVARLWERLPRPAARWSRRFLLGGIVGVLGGLAAATMDWGLHHGIDLLVGRFAHLSTPIVLQPQWAILLLPAAGGLLSGLIVRFFCPDAPAGHGTNLLVRAFHRQFGEMPLRGPLVKAAAAVGVISCGGSAGPEGPIAAAGAAIGSSVGKRFGLRPRERRMLLVAGCAAGVGAIFRCPLGGALFATSVLYREEEFEADAIVPAFVASVLGYSTFMTLHGGLGEQVYLLRGATDLGFRNTIELLPYALLGPLCGLVSIFFSFCLHLVERLTASLRRLPRWFTPVLGGLATGGIACLLPQVMDSRYQFIQNSLTGFSEATAAWPAVALFGGVVLAKCMATALTIGSGASGGVLGPSVFIGGVVGALLGAVLRVVAPSLIEANPELPAALIPVGMGGVLAAAMRIPLASIVMVCEMTGGYGLIVPLMLVCISSYVVGRRWGLNPEQVPTAAESPAHAGDAVVHLLESWQVEQLMLRDWSETVAPETPMRDLVERLRPGTQPTFAVIRENRLLGLISVSSFRRVTRLPGFAELVNAADLMTERFPSVCPDDDAYHALEVLRRGGHEVVPVVARPADGGPPVWLGMLTRERIFEQLHRSIGEMQQLVLREHEGLAALTREGQIQQLMMGVFPTSRDLIQRLLVPMDVVGQSLRQADFRRRYHAQVIAIEQPDGSLQCPPDLDAPLTSGQRLLAVVWRQDGFGT